MLTLNEVTDIKPGNAISYLLIICYFIFCEVIWLLQFEHYVCIVEVLVYYCKKCGCAEKDKTWRLLMVIRHRVSVFGYMFFSNTWPVVSVRKFSIMYNHTNLYVPIRTNSDIRPQIKWTVS